MALRHRLWSLAVCLVVSGCETPDVRPVAPADETAVVSGLVDGVTTKEHVLFRFGVPSSRFEDGRILGYTLAEPEPSVVDGPAAPTAADGTDFRRARSGEYDLLLVFDANHVLARHALIRVHR